MENLERQATRIAINSGSEIADSFLKYLLTGRLYFLLPPLRLTAVSARDLSWLMEGRLSIECPASRSLDPANLSSGH